MYWSKDDLLFLPLGGSDEIGMNVNLYHYKGKWLMIDLGAGFADERTPGIDMLAPDLSFILEHKKDFLGLVLTHAHEDHIGSVPYLWGQLRCPIYATPFTSSVVKGKLAEAGLANQAKVTEMKSGSAFDVGPFSLEMIQVTHSIPEMNGIMIRTELGNVFHSGDWKNDPAPMVGELTNEERLKAYGKEGVLAMVCDSTNVFNDRVSGSEGALVDSLTELIKDCPELVAVTTFASNVARMDTIARVAHSLGRQVALAGRSLWKMDAAARENGYLKGIPPFLSDREVKNLPRDKVLLMCTGCQGEPLAAINKMVSGTHPNIRLIPGDRVIFSSKIIPGNEKKIFRLFNKFVRMGVEVLTEKDHFVHVSGHPSKEELKWMYDMVKPEIALPVHGEPTHLHEHVKFAKSIGVPKQVEVRNGQITRLAPGEPQPVANVQSGYLGVNGNILIPIDGDVIKKRRKLQNDGIVFVAVVLNKKGNLVTEPSIMTPGVLDLKENRTFIEAVKEDLADIIEETTNASEDNIINIVRRTLRRWLNQELGRKPSIEVEVIWV